MKLIFRPRRPYFPLAHNLSLNWKVLALFTCYLCTVRYRQDLYCSIQRSVEKILYTHLVFVSRYEVSSCIDLVVSYCSPRAQASQMSSVNTSAVVAFQVIPSFTVVFGQH